MAEYVLGDMVFNWNEFKAESNEKKHGVTFEEAATAFADNNAQLYDDNDNPENEERFLLLGYSKISRLLMVCHCYRGKNDSVIRIISARKAEKPERKEYEERVKP